MARKVIMVGIGFLLVATGWIASGIAQDTRPDFEFTVNARAGAITVECVRGCGLAWVERGRLRGGTTEPTFTFSCSGVGGTAERACGSGRVGGWITATPASDKE